MSEKIQDRASFEYIRYACCWEDADLLVEAFKDIENPKCLSISSAGDNSLSLLSLNPELVLAIDLSAVQLYCLEIRIAAFKNLEYEEMLFFMGLSNNLHGSKSKIDIYKQINKSLSSEAKNYWDNNTEIINSGIIHNGKFENYLSIFGQKVLPLIHSNKTIENLTLKRNLKERKEYYDKKWNNLRWRMLFKIFFSKTIMGRMGRDPEFFKYVETSVADNILNRTKYAISDLETHNNPYLNYILFKDFRGEYPHCFRRENFQSIKSNLKSLKLFNGPSDSAFKEYDMKFNVFNLSDIFEYMNNEIFRNVSENLIDNAEKGAVLAYWNMLVPRNISDIIENKTEYLKDESLKLFKKDKAFFYRAFVLNKVL